MGSPQNLVGFGLTQLMFGRTSGATCALPAQSNSAAPTSAIAPDSRRPTFYGDPCAQPRDIGPTRVGQISQCMLGASACQSLLHVDQEGGGARSGRSPALRESVRQRATRAWFRARPGRRGSQVGSCRRTDSAQDVPTPLDSTPSTVPTPRRTRASTACPGETGSIFLTATAPRRLGREPLKRS